MKIYLNNEEVICDASSLEALILERFKTKEGMAAAFEGEIIPSSQWADFKLYDGIKIDLFTLTAGG